MEEAGEEAGEEAKEEEKAENADSAASIPLFIALFISLSSLHLQIPPRIQPARLQGRQPPDALHASLNEHARVVRESTAALQQRRQERMVFHAL